MTITTTATTTTTSTTIVAYMDWYQIGELELNRDLEWRNGAVTLRYYAECQLHQSGCR